MDWQKHFTKLQKVKNTQSEIKPIKIEKRPGTTYCFLCKDFTHNFRPQELKMTNKVLRGASPLVYINCMHQLCCIKYASTVLFVNQIS